MPDPMAEIRASFFLECDDLLEALQDGLAAIDSGVSDAETINTCFRAVHSIKGGAGAFGFQTLVRFAHRYETVMDEVRAGRLAPDRDAMLLFFRAADVLSDIVRAGRDGDGFDEAEVEAVLGRLEGLVVAGAGEEDDEGDGASAGFQPMALELELDDLSGSEDDTPAADAVSAWRIEFAPHPTLFVSGNEPQHLLRALSTLGPTEIACDATQIPPLHHIDPESAYLRWSVRLEAPCVEAEIRDVFDFVGGICDLEITAEGEPADAQAPGDGGRQHAGNRLSGGYPSAGPPADDPPSTTMPPPRRLTLGEPGTPSPRETHPAALDRGADHQPSDGDDDAIAAPGPIPAASGGAGAPSSSGRPPSPGGTTSRPGQTQPKATVRVDLERVDRLVNLVGELVINQAMLSQSVREAGVPSNSPVAQGLDEFLQLTRDIQDSVMTIRAQPVKSLFQRMSRIVREAAGALDKQVRLVTDGESTEVDKTVIERLADPLTHMIRNAVDHGLEAAPDRSAAGKPEEGTIRLSAAHRSGRVVIEIADDGGGIDRARVREIAEEKGLIQKGLAMTETEIDHLLFLPGFSTASAVSDLSGRGVGMDVVKSEIQALGGRVAIHSVAGQGTTFAISLPLTLAVLDGMVVRTAGQTLVVPLGAIVETLALRDLDLRSLGPRATAIHLRDAFVPLIDLGVVLGFRTDDVEGSGSVVLLVTQEDGMRVALVVDSIEEQRQVVIKGLQDSYGHVPGIAAATILGDGEVALILDPVDLIAAVAGRGRAAQCALELAG